MYIIKDDTSIYHPVIRQVQDEYLTPCGLAVSVHFMIRSKLPEGWPPIPHVVDKVPKRRRLCRRCQKVLESKS
jgi:hypothetical protein